MVKEFEKSITIGISTSALFEMEEAKKLRAKYGEEFYTQYMIEKEDEPFQPGYFFEVIETMHQINRDLGHPVFDFVLLSTNTAWTGMRAVKSARHYGFDFSSAMFGNGPLNPEYMTAYDINWFITTNGKDAQNAHDLGIASCVIDPLARPIDANKEIARLLSGKIPKRFQASIDHIKTDNANDNKLSKTFNKKLNLVWDLDRVIFDGAADEVFGKHGLEKYYEHEAKRINDVMNDGPFAPIAMIMGQLSRQFVEGASPVKNSVVTARGSEATLRALHSLRDKGIHFDGELHFMAGKDKHNILEIMDKDPETTTLFLDDSERNVDGAKSIVTTGLVPKDNPGGFAIGDEKEAPVKKKAPAPK
jgi:5'-nucleotidase